jgi:hypothetical protein
MKHTDAILSCGSDFALHTFDKHHKPIYKLPPSSAPAIQFPLSGLKQKDPKNFSTLEAMEILSKGLIWSLKHLLICQTMNCLSVHHRARQISMHFTKILSRDTKTFTLSDLSLLGAKYFMT